MKIINTLYSKMYTQGKTFTKPFPRMVKFMVLFERIRVKWKRKSRPKRRCTKSEEMCFSTFGPETKRENKVRLTHEDLRRETRHRRRGTMKKSSGPELRVLSHGDNSETLHHTQRVWTGDTDPDPVWRHRVVVPPRLHSVTDVWGPGCRES